MILISKYFEMNMHESATTKYPNESDHYFLYTALDIDKLPHGPGIARCNSALLDDPEIKNKIVNRLNDTIVQLPTDWNPHVKLDFLKTKLRQFMLEEGRVKARERSSALTHTNKEISVLEEQKNVILMKLANATNPSDIEILRKAADKISTSIDIVKEDIEKLKEEESQRLIFRSRAKWSELGEKSTKYFYNLVKERQAKMIIRKIVSNGYSFYKQDEISKAIEKFYTQLYEKQPNLKPAEESPFLQDLPQLTDVQKDYLNSNLTLKELEDSLKTCNESAPGYDGITYKTYKHLWHILGQFILDSWLYSMQIGETSQSQRLSIITLLEKKGKDRSKIENLRPISLSNCDIKICTKAIAIRTNTVLDSIIGATQTGYVPGRQVNDNNRLIEEVVNQYESIKKKAYLITLDAQKAFDSVDHRYLISCLKAFNFPDTYLSQVKTIYSNLTASVLVNGYVTEKFDIKQSVKQGDALSCSLFIIAMEPLLRKFNSNEGIRPIILNPGNDTEILLTNVAYADDITILCENKEGLQAAIKIYEEFSKLSGVKLNIPKTEVLIVGSDPNDVRTFRIRHNNEIVTITSQKTVKICGITYSNDKNEAYRENITNKITKLERQLNIWRQRNLSLEGKILIVKTYGLSQIIYSLQATTITLSDLKKIENIVYKFIWNIKPASNCNSGRIKRQTLQCNVANSGLNSPNVHALNEAIKYRTCLRHLYVNHPIKHLQRHILQSTGKSFDKDWNVIERNSDSYIETGLSAHNKLTRCIESDIVKLSESDLMIHREYFQYIANHNLISSRHINDNQKYMVNNLRTINIVSLGQLRLHMQSSARFFFETHQLWNSIPVQWKNIINRSRRWTTYVKNDISLENVCIGVNKWKNYKQVSTKEIRQRLMSISDVTKSWESINRNFNTSITHDINPFVINHTSTKNVKLRNVQYKILHNAYPTMKHLFHWKVKISPNCTYCNVTETIEHAIWTCPIAQNSINVLKQLSHELSNVQLDIGKNDFIYGIQRQGALNVIFTLLKRTLVLQREDKHFLTLDDIRKLILSEMNVEKFILKKQGKMSAFTNRWSYWVRLGE
jgi:hypothetical protein